jgi:hypothetical protein
MARAICFSTILAGLSVLFPQNGAQGQTIPSPYRFEETRQEAGFFIGHLSLDRGRFGYGPGPGILYGARYGLRLAGPFGLEATVGYSPTTRDLIDPGRVEGDMKVGDPVDAEMITADARLRFALTGDRTWRGLSPFIVVGGGLAFDRAGESEAESVLLEDDRFQFKRTFMALLGGGVRWIISDRFLLRADGSLTLWRLKTPDGFRDPTREFTGVGEREWVSGPSLSIGLAYHF